MKYYCLLNSNELGRFTTRPLFSLVHAPTTQPKDRGQKTVVGRRCCWLIPICTSLLVAVGDDTQLNLFGGCYIHCILAHPSIWADVDRAPSIECKIYFEVALKFLFDHF